jgi:hypothetical protein
MLPTAGTAATSVIVAAGVACAADAGTAFAATAAMRRGVAASPALPASAAHDKDAIALSITAAPNIRGATAAIPVAVAVVRSAAAVAASVKAAAHFGAFTTHEYRKLFSRNHWNDSIDPPAARPLGAGSRQELTACTACTACTECINGKPRHVGRDGERLALARVIKPLMAGRSNVLRAGCGCSNRRLRSAATREQCARRANAERITVKAPTAHLPCSLR